MAQTASVRLTLNHVATEEQLEQLEERIMSALSDAVAQMRSAVEGVSGRMGDPGAIEAAVAAERERYEALVQSEATEDLAQDAELQAARAEVDRLVGEQTAAAGELVTLADQLNTVGRAVEEAPDEQPVGEVPVELPPSDAEVQAPAEGGTAEPAPAPAEGEATPGEGSTPAPSNTETTDVGVSPDGGAPAEAGPTDNVGNTTTGGPTGGGLTDASGNPVEGPRL